MTTAETWTAGELLEVAKRQKHIIYAFFLGLVVSFFPYGNVAAGGVLLLFIYRLARAIKSRAVWVYIVLAFIPIAALFALLHIIGRATKILKVNGIRVGVMGANANDLERLREGKLSAIEGIGK